MTSDNNKKNILKNSVSNVVKKYNGPVLYIVRHGATDFNSQVYGEDRVRGWIDVPLNAEGKKEAEEIGKFLKDKDISHIFASNLGRTKLTSEIIAKEIGLPKDKITPVIDLRPWNLGMYQGQVSGKIGKELDFYASHYNKVPKGGECFQDYLDRYIPFLREKMDEVKSQGKPIALITHYRNVKVADSWFDGGMKDNHVDPPKVMAGYLPTGCVVSFTWDKKANKWKEKFHDAVKDGDKKDK